MTQSIKQKLKNNFPNLTAAYYFYLSKVRYSKVQNLETKLGFSFMGMKSMQEGTFEPEETEIILNALTDSDLFVDIGANSGYFSCIANNKGVKTISVEPSPDNLVVLLGNLKANGWNNAEVFPVGLGEKPMILDLYGENTGASFLSKWAGSSEFLKQSIAVSTLDIVLGNRFLDKKLFIKIDVEGFEYEVLKGAISTLRSNVKPTWLLEICFTEHHPDGYNPNYLKTFELFWDNGYEAYTADRERLIVKKEDVNRWIKNKKRDFGYANFLFTCSK